MVNSLRTTLGLQKTTTAILSIAFALLSFALHYGLERKLDSLNVFEQYNVMFQADPNERIGAMSHGWGRSGRNIAHPNLSNFTSPFVRAMAVVATRTGIADDAESFRRSIGMLIVPLTAAVTSSVMWGLFLRLGLSLFLSSMFTTLALMSFSPLIFGSIPDHFAMSALVITMAFHLFLATTTDNNPRWRMWSILLFLAAGVTITNVAIIAILMLGAFWSIGSERIKSALHVVGVVSAVLVVTLVSSAGMNKILRGKQLDTQKTSEWATHFIDRSNIVKKTLRFPVAIANTIAPARITTGPPTASFRPDDRYQFLFTLETRSAQPDARNIPGVIAVMLVAGGILLAFRRRTKHRALALAATAILLFNWILHAVWGDEMFLYSQHWTAAVLVLMVVAVMEEKTRNRSQWLVGILAIAVTLNNIALLRSLLDVLMAA